MFSPQHARVQPPALNRAAPFLHGRVGRRDDSGGSSLCVGPFHSTPSSRTAASATAARLVAAVERVLGNTVISQFQAAQSDLTVLEELQVMRRAA